METGTAIPVAKTGKDNDQNSIMCIMNRTQYCVG
jgi:hypothetical protein